MTDSYAAIAAAGHMGGEDPIDDNSSVHSSEVCIFFCAGSACWNLCVGCVIAHVRFRKRLFNFNSNSTVVLEPVVLGTR